MFKSLSTSLILRGILAVAVGIMALAWPQVTVLALVILFAVYAFIAAGLEAMRAFSSPGAGPVFGHLLLGLVDLAAGVVALAWPGPTALVLVLIVGTWAVIAGVVEIGAAFAAGEPTGTRALFILGGLVVDRVRRGAVRPPGRRRDHPGAAVRPVQPGLRRPDARAGHRAAPDRQDHPLRLHGKGNDGGLIRWHDRRRLTETAMRGRACRGGHHSSSRPPHGRSSRPDRCPPDTRPAAGWTPSGRTPRRADRTTPDAALAGSAAARLVLAGSAHPGPARPQDRAPSRTPVDSTSVSPATPRPPARPGSRPGADRPRPPGPRRGGGRDPVPATAPALEHPGRRRAGAPGHGAPGRPSRSAFPVTTTP